MFKDDLDLVRELTAKYGAATPVIEIGGIEQPCVADYLRTIEAMAALRARGTEVTYKEVADAQLARYLNLTRPLSFLGEYAIENPETGGLPIEKLPEKYPGTIGTAIMLSVLEHVVNPFVAIAALGEAMKPGGLVIVSVPWVFPEHDSWPDGRDWWRFNVGALREIFGDRDTWTVLEAGGRLDVPADAGVLQLIENHDKKSHRLGPPQAIRSTYIAARRVG